MSVSLSTALFACAWALVWMAVGALVAPAYASFFAAIGLSGFVTITLLALLVLRAERRDAAMDESQGPPMRTPEERGEK